MKRNSIDLPKKMTQELIDKLGYPPEWEKYVGMPYLSWSQVESWKGKSGFNTGQKGSREYMLKYFFGHQFEDQGWGTFGREAQEYGQEGLHEDKFTEKEKEILNSVEILDIFELPIVIEYDGFILIGFIDGINNDMTFMRDWKCKSESSKKDLFTGEKYQHELYAQAIKNITGKIPEAEYLIVERLGGAECFRGGGRESLYVGGRIWYEPYKITQERLDEANALVIKTAEEISESYKTYKKIFGKLK